MKTTEFDKKKQMLGEHLGLFIEDIDSIESTGNNYFTFSTPSGMRRYLVLTETEANEKLSVELGWRIHEVDSSLLTRAMPLINDMSIVEQMKTLFDEGYVDSLEAVNGVILGFIGGNYGDLIDDVIGVTGRGWCLAVDGQEGEHEGFYIYKKATREGGR